MYKQSQISLQLGYKILIFMYLFIRRNNHIITQIHRTLLYYYKQYFLLVTYIIVGTSLNVVISEQSGDFLYSWSRRYLPSHSYKYVWFLIYACIHSEGLQYKQMGACTDPFMYTQIYYWILQNVIHMVSLKVLNNIDLIFFFKLSSFLFATEINTSHDLYTKNTQQQ